MSEQNPENTYVLPTENAAEMARLIDQDMLLTDELGMFPAGIELHEEDQVLDVACGPGGWTRAVAAKYPQVEVVGLDISRIMINYANAYVQAQKLPNVSFYEADVTKPWKFADKTFDVVNARLMVGFLTREMWPRIISEMMRVLVPGGTLILTEFDDVGRTNNASFEEYAQMAYQAMWRAGLSHHPFGYHLSITPMLQLFLQRVGCQQIQSNAHVIDYSMGTAAHRALCENVKAAFLLVQPYIMRSSNITQAELDEKYQQLIDAMQSEDFRALWYFLRAWGKKPV